MEPERIEMFIHKRFPDAVADQVWAQLENTPSLELYSTPYYLDLLLGQIDAKTEEVHVPTNRAALFSGMVRARLRRECLEKQNPRFQDETLLAGRDRDILLRRISPFPNWLPDRQPLFAALSEYSLPDSGF